MKFKFDAFEAYKSLLCAKHDLIIMCWMIDLNSKVEHLAFDVNQHHIWAIHFNMQTCEISYVTREIYATIVIQMEAKC